ncbi:MAG: Gfo/Idh/MocA family oxidoreductase [Bacteroidales bacterium]|nr:Gfo/Idh/MocA family oxidoreductase [Bacteroidales bacterium]
MIVFDEPHRAAGQQSMLQFAADPIPVVRVGFVGLGMRGPDAVERFCHIDGTSVVALCDKYEDRAVACQKILSGAGRPEAAVYSGNEGYKELCERDDIDLVYICTNWQMHVPVALYALEHGKHVAIEVPSATTIEDCWKLVDASERNRKHCMILENCCYDFFEMTALNMAQHGVFGEILHVEGAYIHNLEPFWKHYADNWRLEYNQQHDGDQYSTHGYGPDCQVLDIHRGDKLNYLVSMSTKSVNGKKRAKEIMNTEEFAQGDHICTLVKTEKGKTISIQHNTFSYRPYNRLYQITGSDGFANKYPSEGFTFKPDNLGDQADGQVPDIENLNIHGFAPADVVAKMKEIYRHPFEKEIGMTAKEIGGHGGMDYIMDWRLVYCLHNGLPLDIDVYDTAEWSCMGELTETSIRNNSMPVKVPDFTRGDWDKLDGLKFHFVNEQ